MAYRSRILIAAAILGLSAVPPRAAPDASKPDAATSQAQDEDEDKPTPAPLAVGSMAIASDPALAIEGMAVDIAVDRVTYTYRLHNKGTAKLALAASVAMPDLEVNTEGTTVYLLPTQNPANPVDLKVTAGDTTIAPTSYLRAEALGIDRIADLKAAGIPLIPFGTAVDSALRGAKPDVLTKLESLGLVTPRDPTQPDTPAIADWTLHDTLGWTQPLDVNETANVAVSFVPVKAVYTVDAAGLPGFQALKDQACLTPPILNAAKAMLKAKGSLLDVTDITLANDGPARWLDNPAASVAVTKPKPNSVIAFCGMNAATANQGVVKGTMPSSADAAGLRVLIFSTH
jgi:hypothetical protein